jgi:hypothetical protein
MHRRVTFLLEINNNQLCLAVGEQRRMRVKIILQIIQGNMGGGLNLGDHSSALIHEYHPIAQFFCELEDGGLCEKMAVCECAVGCYVRKTRILYEVFDVLHLTAIGSERVCGAQLENLVSPEFRLYKKKNYFGVARTINVVEQS